MAIDMFLLFASGANIVGESQDADPAFKNKAIDVLSYRWGLWNPAVDSSHLRDATMPTKEPSWVAQLEAAAGLRWGVQNLVVTKRFDGASVNLIHACQLSQPITKATLILRKAGGKDALQYVKIALEKVFVDQVTSTAGGENELPLETVMLRFQKYTVSYTPQKPDGSGGPEQNWSFDFRDT